MKDVMLDFETFGNSKDKCLCQVGAIYFDNKTGELGKSYKSNIDAASHVKLGGKIDAETVYWWLKQSDAARNSISAVPEITKDVYTVMTELNEFLKDATRIWSHATFDFVTLNDTLKQLNIKPRFSYKAGMDLRTLVYLAGIKVDKTSREGTHHDALDDCKYQVKYCVTSLNAIKTNKKAINLLSSLISE